MGASNLQLAPAPVSRIRNETFRTRQRASEIAALSEIAKRFDIDLSRDVENRELTEDTPIESIARDVRSKEE